MPFFLPPPLPAHTVDPAPCWPRLSRRQRSPCCRITNLRKYPRKTTTVDRTSSRRSTSPRHPSLQRSLVQVQRSTQFQQCRSLATGICGKNDEVGPQNSSAAERHVRKLTERIPRGRPAPWTIQNPTRQSNFQPTAESHRKKTLLTFSSVGNPAPDPIVFQRNSDLAASDRGSTTSAPDSKRNPSRARVLRPSPPRNERYPSPKSSFSDPPPSQRDYDLATSLRGSDDVRPKFQRCCTTPESH